MSEEATLDEFGESVRDNSDDIEIPELIHGVAWSVIESIPDDWTVNNVESDIEILTGNNFSSDYFVEEGGLPLIRIRDLAADNTTINYEGDYDSKYLINQNDLLVGMDGEFEPHLWAGPRALLNQRVCKIEPKNKYNKVFFRYAIEKPLFYIQKSRAGTTVKHLSQSNINDLNLPTPPIDEQRKIASVLHNVEKAIQKTEEIIAQTKRIKKGLMNDLFTEGYNNDDELEEVSIGPFTYTKPSSWEIVTINSVKDGENGLRRGPFGGMLKKEIFVESGYKVYQQQNVIYDDFNYGDYYITEEKYNDMERFSIEAEDLLISCSGTLGEVAKVPDNFEEGVINQALLKFSVDKKQFNVDFVKYLLQSKIGQRQLVLSSRGSAMNNMAPMEFVKSSKLFKPNKAEQRKIADVLNTLDQMIKSDEERKSQFQRLKEGLAQDLLSGTVRTTDTNIEVLPEVAAHG